MSELIYVAHPIDLGNSAELERWLAAVRVVLVDQEVAGFDPGAPYVAPMAAVDKVFRMNNAALAIAGGVLALLPAGVPSVGTPMEIAQARDRGLPVACVGGRKSLQLQAMGVKVFDQVLDAIVWLKGEMRPRPAGGRRLRWTGQTECMPQRFHPGDAGFDLVVSNACSVEPGEFKDIDCGVRVELPEGTWALITGRSSTLRKRKLLVAQGVIDQGYRGPIFAGVWNLGEKAMHVVRGERLAQLIPFGLEADNLRLLEVQELADSARGEKGFGSTGVYGA